MNPEIIAFCNPLLDITINVDESPKFSNLLEKYSLLPNNAVLAEERHLPLYEEIKDGALFSAGGSAQNSLRAAQHVLNRHFCCSDKNTMKKEPQCMFVGSVANDRWMEMMKSGAEKDGIVTDYHYSPLDNPTGTCAVLINNSGLCRSMVANLGAANHYDVKHAHSLKGKISAAKILYISGFFLTVSPDTIHYALSVSDKNTAVRMMNISAPFLCEPFIIGELVRAVAEMDILFGNELELKSLCKALLGDVVSVDSVYLISKLREKLPKKLLLIITQGAEDTILSWDDRTERCAVVPKIPKEQVIDTNGAGDCFVGGFMARMLMELNGNSGSEKKTKEMILSTKEGLLPLIDEGHRMGGEIIKRNGCTF